MSEMKSGDWLCSACRAHNYASRKRCYKCQAEPNAGSFYQKISGKAPQQAFAERDAELEREIKILKGELELAKTKGHTQTCTMEHSFAARQWLESEGFKVVREMETIKGHFSGGIAYDSGDECNCFKCENAGKPTGRFLWNISW
jgi:hypothetical protein